MAHIHSYLDKLSRGDCGSFKNDLLISNRFNQASTARRVFYQQTVDFEARGILLVNEYKGMINTVFQDHCESEFTLKSRFNTCVRQYKTQSHNMLTCTLKQVQEINSMCMAETLVTTVIEEVFSEITVECHVKEEIEQRVMVLSEAIAFEHNKLTGSAFYCLDWQDSSSQTGQRAVVEIKETEDTKELKTQVQRMEQKMDEADSRLIDMAKANRKYLAQLWEFTHAHSYLFNLYQGLSKLQRDVAITSGKENKIQTVNEWCEAVLADPMDQDHLVQVIQQEAAEDISEAEIKKYLDSATAPIAKNISNVAKKIEEKQSVLFHLLEIVMSPAVKEKLFTADLS